MTTQPYADRALTTEQFKSLKPGDRVWVRPVKNGEWAKVYGNPDLYGMTAKVQFEDGDLAGQFGTFCSLDLWEAPPLPSPATFVKSPGESDIYLLTMGGPVWVSAYSGHLDGLDVPTLRALQAKLIAEVRRMEVEVEKKLKDDPNRMVFNIPCHDFRVEHLVRDRDDTEPSDNFDVAVVAGFIGLVEGFTFGSDGVEPMGRNFDLTELD